METDDSILNLADSILPSIYTDENEAECKWFVMRDLKPANAKDKAFHVLQGKFRDIFTPTVKEIEKQKGRIVLVDGLPKIIETPFISDLLFVYDTYETVQSYVDSIPKFQFRYAKGHSYKEPMCVPKKEMAFFKIAAEMTFKTPIYIKPEDLRPEDFGRDVRVMGGPLSGCQCRLLKRRGSSKKRIIVTLSGILSVGVDIEPEYLEFV